jgi:hypothetical protein
MKAVRDGKSAGRVDGTPQTALANLQPWRRSKSGSANWSARVQELEHGVAPQPLALHAKVNHSHDILTSVQQVVVNLRSDVAALAEATQTLVQGQVALIDGQNELRDGLSTLHTDVAEIVRRLPPP